MRLNATAKGGRLMPYPRATDHRASRMITPSQTNYIF